MAKSLHDVLGSWSMGLTSHQRAPAAARKLIAGQDGQRGVALPRHVVEVEEQSQTVFGLGFVLGVHHPGGFLQQQGFDLIILLQFGKERGGRGAVAPGLEDPFDAG